MYWGRNVCHYKGLFFFVDKIGIEKWVKLVEVSIFLLKWVKFNIFFNDG